MTRFSYEPSKNAVVHTRRALRAALQNLREAAGAALRGAQATLDRANAGLAALDEGKSAGAVPTPYNPRGEFGRVEALSARADALLMVAYSAETGNPDHT